MDPMRNNNRRLAAWRSLMRRMIINNSLETAILSQGNVGKGDIKTQWYG